MRSFYSTIPIWLVERLTRDFEMETSSVNEAHIIQPHPLPDTIFPRHEK